LAAQPFQNTFLYLGGRDAWKTSHFLHFYLYSYSTTIFKTLMKSQVQKNKFEVSEIQDPMTSHRIRNPVQKL
jgi:hypothetical protein